MMHLLEFYEETFPEHAIHKESVEETQSNNRSEITTPTDVETPAKKIIVHEGLNNKMINDILN
jgi:hypothetical protein